MAATSNPFDIKTGNVQGSTAPSSGILSGAMSNVAGTDTTGQTANVDTSNAQKQTAPAGTAVGTGYAPALMTGTNWNVDSNQTVAGQTANLVNSDSLLNQRAQTQALQQANGLGLRNSSIAAGMGTAAVLDKSIQIGTADAGTYAASARYNADTANQTAANNQNATNQASAFTANAGNTASSQNAAAANALQSQTTGIIASAAGQDASAKNTAVSQSAQLKLQADLANQAQGYDAAKTQYAAGLQTAMQNADSNTKVALANLDAQVKTTIEQIDAQFKTQMQTSQSSAAIYSQVMTSIGNIMNNKDLDATAMQNAIAQQLGLLQSAMTLQQGINQIQGLDPLISNITGGSGAPAGGSGAPAGGSGAPGSATAPFTPRPTDPVPGNGQSYPDQ
jgi:hypothetical protein